MAHLLVWILIHGKYPDRELDHINNIRNDNRVGNLREATEKQNSWNRKGNKTSKCEYKGVQKIQNSKKWMARIGKDGIFYRLGSFVSKEEAAIAYNKKALELFGEFAKLNIIN